MKEEMLYVSDDPADDRAMDGVKEEIYELPDGQQVALGRQRVAFTEKLF